MSFLKNTISLMALFSVIPAAHAATARPGVMPSKAVAYNTITGAARRIPTVSQFTTGGTIVQSGTSLLADKECVESYTSCIKSGESCGANFEECTTDVLFHGKMPNCLSVLGQCSSAGINSLFGTSNVSALNNADSYLYGEITKYTYPTDGSILGQMISAAKIENMYNTSDCVRRYTSCLKKESVCGSDFELCTSNSEFKKQAVFCDSTLARCQGGGKQELFGNGGATSSTAPVANSRIGEMISEGAALAAVNAVSTCYKVADQCILSACSENPYKCVENSPMTVQELVAAIKAGTSTEAEALLEEYEAKFTSRADVKAYIKNSCESTIGSNKYCYATFIGDGKMPSNAQLRDEDNHADIFEQAYDARMNSGMRTKIDGLVKEFDTYAKQKCVDTIKTCAMRTCGGGSGAACYALVYGNGTDSSINKPAGIYNEIKNGCSAIVNTDLYCKYSAQNIGSLGNFTYSFVKKDTFSTLFPKYDEAKESDPIGVVAALNASLTSSYNDASIAQMKKRCQSVATSCVKSLCGTDYQNCYRNRMDVYSTLTKGYDGNVENDLDEFNKSMNKVSGVLDYTIILGMCMETVKNSDACAEHVKITKAKEAAKAKTEHTDWGTDAARSEWLGAGEIGLEVTGVHEVTDDAGNKLCYDSCNARGLCDTATNLADCGMHDTPITIDNDTYSVNKAAENLFKELIYDLEIQAQATYNAKLTAQQNSCMAMNSKGGILGANDSGSVYMWAKLKAKDPKVPADYLFNGLTADQTVASNDLYGSFCRVRVTLGSDDADIQNYFKGDGVGYVARYFAIGDPITCGSWLSTEDLDDLAEEVGKKASTAREESFGSEKVWGTVLGTLGFGAGGLVLGDQIAKGNILNDVTNIKENSKDDQEKCAEYAQKAIDALDSNKEELALSYAKTATTSARKAKVDDDTIDAVIVTECKDQNDKCVAQSELGNVYDEGYVTQIWKKCAELRGAEKGDKGLRDDCDCARDVKNATGKNACSEQSAALKKVVSDYNLGVAGNHEECGTGDSALKSKSITANLDAIPTYDQCAKARFKDDNPTNALKTLKEACETNTKEGKGARNSWRWGTAAATAGVGGLATYLAIDSYQKGEMDKAKQEAMQEFMDSIGSKIKCYIGSDEIGTYGQVIPTSME